MSSEPTATGGATVQDAASRTTAKLRRARLVVVSGSERGMRLELGDDGVLIGSKPPADLVLAEASVSRRHAEVRRIASGWVLRDLGSTNGTFAGGARVETAHLADGAVFRVGKTEVAFEAREEDVSLSPDGSPLEGVVAESPLSRELVAALRRFGPTDLSIVLEGETGSGKEVAARTIHALGAPGKPFVVVDCGALSESLVESELFGHERGAFTGAQSARAGAFEAADGGTLFLDEVGELPAALQPKLLRAIEAREVRRLGSNRVRRVDFRLVAATNRDLAAEVAAKRFRADLFFRLSEVRLRVPPLRERPEDVVPLARAIAREVDGAAVLSDEALAALRARDWPGNVRELSNVVRRAVVAAGGAPVGASHLAPSDLGRDATTGPSVAIDVELPLEAAEEAVVAAFKKKYLEALLSRHGGDVRAVARHARVHEKSLYRLLRKAGIKPRG